MFDVGRRKFIATLAGAAAAWSLAARAQQQEKIPRIGIIDDSPRWNAFRHELRDLGYLEGQNVAFDYAYGDGAPERLAEAAAQLVRGAVDVIATYGTAASFAAKEATSTIPIVMISVGDPVRAGLVTSLAHPGGNVTGNTILGPDIGAKRVQLLQELIPMVRRVAFLWNPNNASHAAYRQELQAAAPALNVKLLFVEVGSASEFDSAFAAMMKERPDAFSMTGDPFHQLHVGWIIDFMAKNRLPACVSIKRECACGGTHVLRCESARLVPPCCDVCEQDSTRHQAGGPAGGATNKIRVGDESQDRQGDRADDSRVLPAPRRRGNRMRRREFIALVGSAATWPLAARAQQADRVRRICVLMQLVESDPQGPRYVTAFVQGLKDSGWVDGRNLQLEYR
jgi:putative ABC transport system substrate-binding protein